MLLLTASGSSLLLPVSILGWFSALPAILTLAEVLGGHERSSKFMLVYAFVAAAILTLVEFTSEVGTASASDWMSTWPLLNVPDDGNRDRNELTPAQGFEMTCPLVAGSRSLGHHAI